MCYLWRGLVAYVFYVFNLCYGTYTFLAGTFIGWKHEIIVDTIYQPK